jgi:Xaa-Pro aminopeptidase
MEREGFDALVATTPQNVVYSTGFCGLGHRFISGTLVFAVVPKDSTREAVLVAPVAEMDLVCESDPRPQKVHPYGIFYLEQRSGELSPLERDILTLAGRTESADPFELLARVCEEEGLGDARLGVDEYGLTVQGWDRLASLLPGAKIAPAWRTWQVVRMVKTGEEIGRLRRAAEITEAAIAAVLAEAREGMTEEEAARVFEAEVVRRGASPVLTVIGFGERSAFPNVTPTGRKLRPGDIIRFDVGCCYRWYYSDLARIAVFGEPSPRQQAYYEALLAGERAALAAMRPGVRVADVFETAVQTVRERGIPHYRRHHCGHGIGVEVYDPPTITPNSTQQLEAGMVFCVETPYYEMGFGGLQVEDMVVVTADGVELLSGSDPNLRVVAPR